MGTQDPRLDFFTSQSTGDEPGTAFDKGNATAVVSQTFNGQTLLFTGGHLRSPAAATRLEAQASLLLGHQLGASKMPVDK